MKTAWMAAALVALAVTLSSPAAALPPAMDAGHRARAVPDHVVLVQSRGPQYDRRRHGPRYRTARPGYTHERDGYFYHEEWWSIGSAPIGSQRQRSNAHVAWCTERYRSYDAASDSYLSFEGVRRRCNSAY